MHRHLLSDSLINTSTPPLPPELWNFVVIIVIGVLFGWTVRVMNLLAIYLEARAAVHSDAVLYLKNLGPSISVLENASMWHFQHLLRTKVEPSITKIKRVEVPFDILSSSLQVMHEKTLSFTFRTKTPCTVQIMWDVKREALENAQRPRDAVQTDSDRVLPSLRHTLRLLPMLFSRVRRQNRRHELRDEVENDPDRGRSLRMGGRLHEDDYSEQSAVQRFNSVEDCTFSASIPSVVTDTLRQNRDAAIDSPPNSSTGVPTTTLVRSRYSAVVVIRAIALSTSPTSFGESTFMGKIGISRRRNSTVASPPTITCQYLAIELLPTPSKQVCFTPVIAKTINFTNAEAFLTQDVYGHVDATGSECAICLEGVVSVVLLPCRHFCVCQVCLEEIDRCPICRTKFSTYVYSNVAENHTTNT